MIEVKITEDMKATLDTALLLYKGTYSIELIGCLYVNSKGNIKRTVNSFVEFQSQFGKTAYIQELISKMYLQLKNYTEAATVLSWLINQKNDLSNAEKKRDVNFLELLSNRANAYEEIQKYYDAIDDWNTLIKLNPVNSNKFRIRLGKVYLMLGG